MYKKELYELFTKINEFNKAFVDLKVAVHTIDKCGFNVESIYKQLDNVGIETYKIKIMINDFIKEKLKK